MISLPFKTLPIMPQSFKSQSLAGDQGGRGQGLALVLEGVSVSRGGKQPVLRNISLALPAGTRMGIVGPSGSGKTTLLRTIAGLERLAAGALVIDGRDAAAIPPHQRGIGMIFQDDALYPHLTVAENLHFPLRAAGVPRGLRQQKVADLARRLGIESLLDRDPSQLSGGQRRRVAVGRGVIAEPRLLLLDEPLSQLDTPLRWQLRELLLELQAERGMTMLMVTHDATEAMSMVEHLVVLEEGIVAQAGEVRQVSQEPCSATVASLLTIPPMNFLDVTFESGPAAETPMLRVGTDGPRLPWFGQGLEPGPLRLGFPPTAVSRISLGLSPEHGNRPMEDRTAAAGDGGESTFRLLGRVRVSHPWLERWLVECQLVAAEVDGGSLAAGLSPEPQRLRLLVSLPQPPATGSIIEIEIARSRCFLFCSQTAHRLWPLPAEPPRVVAGTVSGAARDS